MNNPKLLRLRKLNKKLRQEITPLKPLHHSTGDWDFDDDEWELDGSIYVSAPSSLKCLDHDYTDPLFTYVKTTVVPIATVKEGRIETQCRFALDGSNNRHYILFRFQDATNHYQVRFNAQSGEGGRIYCYRFKTGDNATLEFKYSLGIPNNTWFKLRVTWWNDSVGLVIRVELDKGSGWELMFDAYDSQNNWKTIGGRIGLGFCRASKVGSSYQCWFDDTYIYGFP